VRGSTPPSLPRLANLLAIINSASSMQNYILNAHTLVIRGEYPTFTGRLMADLQLIQLVLWILLMRFQNPIFCRETAFDSAEEEETCYQMIKQE
jgi:hypothetical protein